MVWSHWLFTALLYSWRCFKNHFISTPAHRKQSNTVDMIPASVCQHKNKTIKPQFVLNSGGFAFEWCVYLKHQTGVQEERKNSGEYLFGACVWWPQVNLIEHCQFVNDHIWGALWWWWGIIGLNQLHTPELGLCHGGFPPPCQPAAACLFTHRAEPCQW